MAAEVSRIGLIVIDAQRNFLTGSWMAFIGPGEVTKISHAFNNISSLLQKISPDVHVLTTKCFGYTEHDFSFYEPVENALANLHSDRWTNIIKPHNNILDGQGAHEWLHDILSKGIKQVVIGGCTVTSCVRVSSSEIQKHYSKHGIQVYVDLSLCGARDSNYTKRCEQCLQLYMYNSLAPPCGKCEQTGDELKSPVDKAVEFMTQSGVTVMQQFDWSKYFNQQE